MNERGKRGCKNRDWTGFNKCKKKKKKREERKNARDTAKLSIRGHDKLIAQRK